MKRDKGDYRAFAMISQLGISIMVPIILCTLLGSFLEEKYKIPVTIPFIILGFLAGGRNAYMLIKKISEDDDEEDNDDEDEDK